MGNEFCGIADTKLNYTIHRKLVFILLRTGNKFLSTAEPSSRKYSSAHAEFQGARTGNSVGIKIRVALL
jgi:hypothetical protein